MNEFPAPDVGVVFALGAEQGCFEDLLSDVQLTETPAGKFRRGTLAGRTVISVVAGAGRPAAGRACEALLLGHRPRLVVSAGFCGALDAPLRRNDVVVADRLTTLDGRTHVVEPSTLAKFQFGAARVGPFIEVDRIVAQAVDKQRLAAETGGMACEMESSAVAEVCAARGVPFLAVRVVSDVRDEDLPSDLGPLLEAQASPMQTLGAVFGAVWRRPSSVKDMLQLKETALVAADHLARYLAGLVEQLPTTALPDEKASP